MAKEIEIGENLGCFLVVLVIAAACVASGTKLSELFSDESVDCVKAGGQWHEPNGCGAGHCERVSK